MRPHRVRKANSLSFRFARSTSRLRNPETRNSPIQGTGSDILKRALRLLHNDLRGTTDQIVNIIHDEIVVECDEADAPRIAERVCRQMVAAGQEYLHQVPVVAEPKIADDDDDESG